MSSSPLSNQSGNRTLSSAKKTKQDEFYTQYVDIQKEVESYLEYDPKAFRNKVVFCNCDDPRESKFFEYFATNFNKLGLKRLISTSYDGSLIAGQQTLFPEYNEGNGKRQKPKALGVILESVQDEDGDGAANIVDVELFLQRNKAARIALKGDPDKNYRGGDFRSSECVEFLKQADIVVTNPPFSLFRDFISQLVELDKRFLVIGPQNAITYKEIFPLIRDNKVWLGVDNGGTKWFQIQDDYEFKTESRKKTVDGVKFFSRGDIVWFTNLDHGRRHQELDLMTMADNLRYSKKLKGLSQYQIYDNFDAIEVPYTETIPSDYPGMMGVPITFLDKYNPEQFEILGYEHCYELHVRDYPAQIQVDKSGKRSKVTKLNDACAIKVEKPPEDQTYYIVDNEYYVAPYKRIFIRHRNPKGAKT